MSPRAETQGGWKTKCEEMANHGYTVYFVGSVLESWDMSSLYSYTH